MSTNPISKSDQRRERILSIAKSLFFEVGYANATMNEIAARVGGSKATLYAYFKSKEELFSAIIFEHCSVVSDLLQPHIGTKNLAQSLREVSRGILPIIYSDHNIRIIQLVIEEGQRNPRLGEMFQKMIEDNGKQIFLVMLQQAHDSGQIEAPDTLEAANVLKSLLMGELHFRRVLSVAPEPDMETLAAHIDRSVAVFMAYYGKK